MRSSDWSSDVCSADLFGERQPGALLQIAGAPEKIEIPNRVADHARRDDRQESLVPEQFFDRWSLFVGGLRQWRWSVRRRLRGRELGRASGRERVCQYV